MDGVAFSVVSILVGNPYNRTFVSCDEGGDGAQRRVDILISPIPVISADSNRTSVGQM
jgi:hypothetical protein